MTKWQRVKGVLGGLFTLLIGVLTALLGDDAVPLIMLILALSLTIKGIRTLFYYFTMARHMVGGDRILIQGLILFDLGTYTATLTKISKLYIIAYLFAIHVFSGFIDVLRAFEEKRFESDAWKFKLSTGIVNIAIGILCVVFMKSIRIAVYIYSAGIIYSAVIRIITSFRKTAVVYITP